MAHTSVPAGTHIGHVHLNVSDLDRAVNFYHDVMGFDLVTFSLSCCQRIF